MSVQAISWAMAQDLDLVTMKFTLVALANYADGEGRCFPSQKQLGDNTGQSVRTIRSHVIELERLGFLVRGHRQREDGSRTSDEYFLQIQPAMVAARKNPTGKIQQANRQSVAGVYEPSLGTVTNNKKRGRITNPADLLAEDFEASDGVNVGRELEKFRNHSKAKARRHKDAAAAFKNWLLIAEDYLPKQPRPPNGEGRKVEDIDYDEIKRLAGTA